MKTFKVLFGGKDGLNVVLVTAERLEYVQPGAIIFYIGDQIAYMAAPGAWAFVEGPDDLLEGNGAGENAGD